jgi:2'-deoxynucleoside 5'-phosphate N-hydrolase
MNIYFSCSLTGGRNDQPIYAAIVQWLVAQGHHVSTAHLTQPTLLTDEDSLIPEAVFTRDIAWLDAADLVIAEVSTPSHGVGYEIAHAVLRNTRVLCLARQSAKVSKMLSGNPGVVFARYVDEAGAIEVVRAFLA